MVLKVLMALISDHENDDVLSLMAMRALQGFFGCKITPGFLLITGT